MSGPGASGLPQRLERLLWGARETPRPRWQQRGLHVLRFLTVLARDVALGQLTLRAMSLVYTTLLSIVPLFALSFSVLKAFGVTNQIRPLLLRLLEPLGDKGIELAGRIASFIENMNVGVLGALGLALLLYTAISLMQKIEESLNFIWHIPQPRRLGERFTRYLSALMVGPLLVFSALGVTATVMNIDTVRELLAVDALGEMVQAVSRAVPYLLVIAAFTFVYRFIPNTRVRLGAALFGGFVGGVAWQTAGWLFALFVVSSGKYAAIYSGFAILVLFMIWLYVSWLVLLFGASVAFYTQHPEYLLPGSGEAQLSPRLRERLALAAMNVVTARFLAAEPACSQDVLARRLGVPPHLLAPVLDALQGAGLLLPGADDPPSLLPARDVSLITVAQVLDAVRRAGESPLLLPHGAATPAAVDEVLGRLQVAVDEAVGTITLRELAGRPPATAAIAGAVPQSDERPEPEL